MRGLSAGPRAATRPTSPCAMPSPGDPRRRPSLAKAKTTLPGGTRRRPGPEQRICAATKPGKRRENMQRVCAEYDGPGPARAGQASGWPGPAVVMALSRWLAASTLGPGALRSCCRRDSADSRRLDSRCFGHLSRSGESGRQDSTELQVQHVSTPCYGPGVTVQDQLFGVTSHDSWRRCRRCMI